MLKVENGRLAYEAHPSAQAAAVFLSTEVTDVRVVFESPEHDDPQRVGYERRGDDSLLRGSKELRMGTRGGLNFRTSACPATEELGPRCTSDA